MKEDILNKVEGVNYMDKFQGKVAEEIAKQVPVKDIYDDIGKPILGPTGQVLGITATDNKCCTRTFA